MLREAIIKNWISYDPDEEQTRTIFESLSESHLLVACSSGPDSLALALIAYCLRAQFSLAYVEHELSEHTASCALAVKQLSDDLDVDFYTTNIEMSSLGNDSNIEARARDLRYEALEKMRQESQSDYILTAHMKDDVAETFLINLLRGSGSGTASLARRRDVIVRPLLHWRKTELENFVTSCGYEYFEDPANKDPRFVRNRIRHEVMPLLNEISDRDVVPLLARASSRLSEDHKFLKNYASSLWPQDDTDTRALAQLDPVLQRHALREWIQGYPPSSEEMERILDVVHHRIKRTQISGNRTIWRRGALLYQDITSVR